MINKIINTAFIISIFLFSILTSCSESDNNKQDDSETDSLKTEIQNDTEISEESSKDEKTIIELLRSLDEGEYGGVDHLKDEDFKIIDNEKRFVEYLKEGKGEYEIRTFKQIASGERNIFVKASYDKYNSGNSGYFCFTNLHLLEYKDEKWINLKEELPENWTKDYYAFFSYIDKPEMYLYKIDFDKKTGKEIKRELLETAKWEDGKFVVTQISETNKKENYKIIVAYASSQDVSEDWNYFYSDIESYFKEKGGVYVINNSGKKASVDNTELTVEIDLTSILAKNKITGNCYIFIENGKEAKCIDYDMPDVTIEKAKKYFGIK